MLHSVKSTFIDYNCPAYNIAIKKWLLSIHFYISFLLSLDSLQQMLFNSLVHAAEIFQRTGTIFQFLLEAPRYFQPSEVFGLYKPPNNLKSTIFEAVH